MFSKLRRIKSLFYCMEEPVGDPAPGGGGTGDPAPTGEPTPTGDPAPAHTEFKVPEGQVLVSKEQQELLNWYNQFGTPQELYNSMTDYRGIKAKGEPVPASTPAEAERTEQLNQVKELILEVFPHLKELPDFMQSNKDTRIQFADSAAQHAIELGIADELSLTEKEAKLMLVNQVTWTIQHDPGLLGRFRANDISSVDEAYKRVASKYYNKGNGVLPAPPSKLSPKPINKSVSPEDVKNIKPAKDFDEAGSNAFERLREYAKGG